jgi:hypothetical protein
VNPALRIPGLIVEAAQGLSIPFTCNILVAEYVGYCVAE